MKTRFVFKETVMILLVLVFFYFLSRFNYLLFHTTIELISIIVAFSLFSIAWNSREFNANKYLLFIGVAFIFIGSLDLIHTLSYKGMNLFPGNGANLPTQLWIIARFMEGMSFLLASYYIKRKFKAEVLIIVYLSIFIISLILVFANLFPDCFVEGKGLTLFKKISEYVISLILIFALWRYHKLKHYFIKNVRGLIYLAMIFTIFSEISFTFYISVYGLSNFIGHIFKFISFYLIYKALIVSSLKKPYQNLFIKLHLSEKRYRKAQEIAHVGNWEYNFPTADLWSSDEAKRIFGFDPQAPNLTIDGVESCIADKNMIHQSLLDLRENSTPSELIFKITTKDKDEIRFVHSQTLLEKDSSGKPLKFWGVILDITEYKKKESELNDIKKKLENTEIIAKIGGWYFDIETGNTYLSIGIREIYEIGPDRHLPIEEGIKFYAPEHQPVIESAVQKCMKTGESYDLELKFITAKGNNRWVRTTGNAEYQNDKIIRLNGIFQDITARKLMEKDLIISEERFQLAMQATRDGIFDWNLETNEIYYSLNWKSMLGYKDDEIKNEFSEYERLTQEDDFQKIRDHFESLKMGKCERFEMEFKMRHKDGHWVDILSRADKVLNDMGKAIRIVGIHQDISEIKKYRQNLEKLVDQRTKTLEEKNAELSKYNKIFIGREFRIKELRDEVKALQEELKKS